MRPVAFLAAACLVLTPALAGCAVKYDELRASIGIPRDEIPAKSAAALAEDEARAWAPDARLAGAFTWEAAAAWTDGMPSGSHNASFSFDSSPGDGRARAWALTYHSASRNESFSLVVSPNGTIAQRDAHDGDDAMPFPEGAWAIDSPEAIEALAGNETWSRAAAEGANAYIYALGYNEGEDGNGTDDDAGEFDDASGLVWAIVMFSKDRAPVVGLVNATTGSVYGVYAFNFDFDWSGDWSWGGDGGDWSGPWWPGRGNEERYEGTLNVVQPVATHTYHAPLAGELEIALEYAATPAPAEVTIRVTGPDGQDVPGQVAPDGEGELEWEGHALSPGPYEITLTLETPGVSADYELVAAID